MPGKSQRNKLSEDPKKRLAEFETEGEDQQRQKTRLHSKEQARFYIAYHFLSEVLGDDFDFYSEIADADMEIMMSYKGLRSDDVRDMFRGMGDDDMLKVGNQPELEKYLRDRGRSKDADRNR